MEKIIFGTYIKRFLKMKGLMLVLIILLAVGIIIFMKCKLDCKMKEGLSHRLSTTNVLLDNAYGKRELPSYSNVDWPMTLKDPREKYTDMYKCAKKCQNIMGNSANGKCIQDCMDHMSGNYLAGTSHRYCGSDDDCGKREVCVEPAPYTSGKYGMCMDENEPGVPKGYYREGFRGQRCPPTYFYNEVMNQCQPRWQGDQSGWYVSHERPGPEPEVSIPGTTLKGYGTGYTDPMDLRLPGFILETDQ